MFNFLRIKKPSMEFLFILKTIINKSRIAMHLYSHRSKAIMLPKKKIVARTSPFFFLSSLQDLFCSVYQSDNLPSSINFNKNVSHLGSSSTTRKSNRIEILF